MFTSEIGGGNYGGTGQNTGAPLYRAPAGTDDSTLFGGTIPAVHFGPVARMSQPVEVSPTWQPATSTPAVGGRVNIRA